MGQAGDAVRQSPKTRPFVLGVAGGSGSGKTTLVRNLLGALGRETVSLIDQDSYYNLGPDLSPEDRERANYDHPDALETSLLVFHLDQLKSNRPVEVPIYDFKRHCRLPQTRHVKPATVVIVEGILVFCDKALRERMDLRVYVDTDEDVRFMRRWRRDCQERARTTESVIAQYFGTVKPMHLRFVEPSKEHAHLIVPGGRDLEVASDVLLCKLRSLLPRPSEPGK
jgi:uridine kinase